MNLEENVILYGIHFSLYSGKWSLIHYLFTHSVIQSLFIKSVHLLRQMNKPVPHIQSGPPTFSKEQNMNVARAACHFVHILRQAEFDTSVFNRFYVPLPLLRAIPVSPKTSLPGSSSMGQKLHQVTERRRTPISRNLSNNHATSQRHRNVQELYKTQLLSLQLVKTFCESGVLLRDTTE
jgi:hypothetical protein